MAAFYPQPVANLPLGRIVGALAVLLVAITAIALYQWRRRPYVIVGWLWFLGMLVPVSGLMPVGSLGHARADRYTYLSQIGLSIALAWLVWRVYQSRESRGVAPGAWRRWVLQRPWRPGAVSSRLAITVAWRQTPYWRNTPRPSGGTCDFLHSRESDCPHEPRRWLPTAGKDGGSDHASPRSFKGWFDRSGSPRHTPLGTGRRFI